MKHDSRDWRSHLEQMHTYRDGIESSLDSTKTQLDKLHTDIARTLEKIASREKYLNNQLEGPLSDLRQLQDKLAATKEQYRQVKSRSFNSGFIRLIIFFLTKFDIVDSYEATRNPRRVFLVGSELATVARPSIVGF